ncbi:unnamed protein product [Ixodes pacificus]
MRHSIKYLGNAQFICDLSRLLLSQPCLNSQDAVLDVCCYINLTPSTCSFSVRQFKTIFSDIRVYRPDFTPEVTVILNARLMSKRTPSSNKLKDCACHPPLTIQKLAIH